MRSVLPLVVIVGFVALPATTYADGLRTLQEESGTGPVWVARHIAMDGATVVLDLRTSAPTADLKYGIAVLNSTEVVYAEVGALRRTCDLEAFVLVARAPDLVFRDADPCEPFGLTIHVTFAGLPREYAVVQWLAGDIGTWSSSTRAADGVELLGSESGPEAFAFEPRDFRGTANVGARAADLDARAAVRTEARVDVERVLFGAFFVGPGDLASTVANGTREPCSCWFGGTGPGEYGFRLTGAGERLLLTGADVRLPASTASWTR